MKRFLISAIAVLTVFSAISAGNAAVLAVGDPGRSWAQPNDASVGQHIQWFIDTFPNELPSFLALESNGWNAPGDPTCESMKDAKCAGKRLSYQAMLPKCSSTTSTDCTEDFGTITDSGVKTSAVFARYFPEHAQNEFQGDDSAGLPSGVSTSIYSIPSNMHDGGDKYALSVVLSGSVSESGEVSNPSLDIRISPIALESSQYFTRFGANDTNDAGWALITDHNTGVVRWGQQAAGFSGDQYCVANSAKEKLCAQKYAFPADTKFYVKLRVSKSPGGWMHGRISSPDIQIEQNGQGSSIEFRGYPVAVPTVYKKYEYPEMPTELKKQYSVQGGGYLGSCNGDDANCQAGGRSGPSTNPLNRNVIISPAPYDKGGMDQLKLWLPYVNDKATALLSFWSVRTLSRNEMDGANSCYSDNSKITGIVTTNSTQYSAGPPSFSKAEQTLDYKVSSPHFGSTGEVFKGTYDLVIRPDVARCVYGFSKAPIKATISITSADGSPQTATTLIGENKNWVYLSAKNFEFSSPTVKVTLSQEAEPQVEVTQAPVVPTIAKKTSITCVKGKATKKITAVNPKCPTGYKKKA